MKYTDVKNLSYANEDKTLIICDVKFELLSDYIPFAASPDDTEDHGRSIYNECIAGNYGNIGDYTSPVIDYILLAEYRRDSLLSSASDKIKDWRTELELEIISDDDKVKLVKWMVYIKDLKSIDLTRIKNKAEYESVSWVEMPE
ncbi:tail fiber assembly protein [Klebsiella sp. RHBSTW-00215]|uniref:tail fiber assembly protein n=1 Tax=Klebsiella sp. RHBSTW-00215 TaxID=2742640 RepID=UPI0015F48E2D|nr:tail fiber assembly protein [Klebsiella sp. RHBSTW-00215]MBA7932982.1 tail fiber assembly protein [Klebsiella sp. RHBSTW-00215]